MSCARVMCLFQIIFFAFANAVDNVQTTVQQFEGDGCDQLIPNFIHQILENGNDCEATGKYPKPGDCTVFFKCIRGRGRILPFLEYCATGYTFIDDACMPNKNSSDCPQFNCFPMKTVAEANQAPGPVDTISGSINDPEQNQEPSEPISQQYDPHVPDASDYSLVSDIKGGKTEMPQMKKNSKGVVGPEIGDVRIESEEGMTAAQKSSSGSFFLGTGCSLIKISVLFVWLLFCV